MKVAAQKEYEAANTAVRKSIRRDKNNYIEDLAQHAEDAAGKKLSDGTSSNHKEDKQAQVHIHETKCALLTSKEDQFHRWTQHFRELLTRLYQLQTC